MKFVLIFGPQAVGKMTVGHEHEKMTDLKLFHNHYYDYDFENSGTMFTF